MQLEKVRLSNFKCFAEQEFSLGKITLLLGANSSGKSSLIYAILAALQSDPFPLTISVNGDLVNLGDFDAVSAGHDKNLAVGIGLEFAGTNLGNVELACTFRRFAKTGMPRIVSGMISDTGLSIRFVGDQRYQAEWTYNAELDPQRRTPDQRDAQDRLRQTVHNLMEE